MMKIAIVRKIIGYTATWLFFTLICGFFGLWWPIRNIDKPWAGDGIGMIFYGGIGLVVGAVVGLFAILVHLSIEQV